MFEVEYKGGNGVVITTKKVTAIFDPKLSVIGLRDLKVDNAVEIATEARLSIANASPRLAIEGPGDYELGDFSIHGVRAVRHIDTEESEPISTMYRIGIGDYSVAVVGNIAPKLREDQLEELGVVDILVLPVGGGGYTLDATAAATIVRQVNPKAVIPVHYADDALRYEVPQDILDTFVKELGVATTQVGTKFKVKSSTAIPQTLTVIEVARS